MTREAPTGPLSGVNVLNIGTAIVGPWAATLLGYLGANVIKVERPSGETTRLAFPKQNGWATGFIASNVNQRLVLLDTKNVEHQAVLDRLAGEADILIENYRPGVAERMGIGYPKLSIANPGLVYISSSGWGDAGPMKQLSAVDPHLQAFSGFAALNGAPGGQPEMIRYTHIDPSGATLMAAITVLGLVGRERFGAGTLLKTSHLAMSLCMESSRLAECLATGSPLQRLGSATAASAPNQCFRAQDQKDIAITAETDAQWLGFCEAIQKPELASDERFKTNADRVKNREVLAELLARIIANKPSRWWVVQLTKRKVPFAFSLDFEQISNHRQIVENEYLTTITPKHTGDMFVGGVPWQFSKTPAAIDRNVAEPGSDTAHVIENGFTKPAESRSMKLAAGLPVSRLPLDGVRVIDATQGISGPLLGLLLAEAGAEVIKVEPPEGDWSRRLEPRSASGESALFAALNRNKSLSTVDLEIEAGRAQFQDLISDAAIVLEDWGPGRWKGSTIDPEMVLKANARLVWLSLSPFGEKGPMASRPGSELAIQAMTGYLRTLGHLGGAPVRVGADIAGCCTAANAFLAVLAAYFNCLRTGNGQRVAVSQLGTLMSMRTLQWAAMSNPDAWLGNSYCTSETDSPRHGYRTKDAPIFVSMMNLRGQEQFITMMKELGMYEAVKNDERFIKDGRQTVGMGHLARDLQSIWETHLKNFSALEAIEIINRNGGTAVEFSELHQLVDHPQVKALDLVQHLDGVAYLRAPWAAPWPLPTLAKAQPYVRESTTSRSRAAE